jgi:hypothetical protein
MTLFVAKTGRVYENLHCYAKRNKKMTAVLSQGHPRQTQFPRIIHSRIDSRFEIRPPTMM